MQQSVKKNYLLLLYIGLIWGSQYLFIELSLKSFPPLTIAAARMGLGALMLAGITLFLPRPAPHEVTMALPTRLWRYFLVGLFEALLPAFLIAWGQQQLDSSLAAIIMGTIPIFTIVFAVFFEKGYSWSLPSALCVLLGFIGIVVLVGPSVQGSWTSNVYGELAILTGSMCFAISILLTKTLPNFSPIRVMRNVLGMASIPLVILATVIDHPWTLQISLSSSLALLVLGTICSGVVYSLYVALIRRAGGTFTSLANYITPLVGTILGVFILGESLTWNEFLAFFIIIAALLINESRTLMKWYFSRQKF